jgi:hypothetical protein
MSCDAAVHAMLFPSRDGKERSVTASLQVCACTMSAPSGDLCLHCGCHGIVVDHNLECEKDACGLNTLLLHCAACNVSFHEECMELLNWGLSRFDEANVKNAPARPAPILDWLQKKRVVLKPITHHAFIKYDAPLPLELAKQQDLRVLAGFLARYMPQDEIDELYPEPDRNVSDTDDSDDASDDDSE